MGVRERVFREHFLPKQVMFSLQLCSFCHHLLSSHLHSPSPSYLPHRLRRFSVTTFYTTSPSHWTSPACSCLFCYRTWDSLIIYRTLQWRHNLILFFSTIFSAELSTTTSWWKSQLSLGNDIEQRQLLHLLLKRSRILLYHTTNYSQSNVSFVVPKSRGNSLQLPTQRLDIKLWSTIGNDTSIPRVFPAMAQWSTICRAVSLLNAHRQQP